MKLLFCPSCHDIRKLISEPTACFCGKSSGHYTDERNAVYSGDAVPLGIDNRSFASEYRAWRDRDYPAGWRL
ncbi:MAG: hypothetical protein KGR26_15960, partial [Cyanobacteria bacterium REEB65]|nr:hypothetical protein [Cyanobacteria bacterium REEB65]